MLRPNRVRHSASGLTVLLPTRFTAGNVDWLSFRATGMPFQTGRAIASNAGTTRPESNIRSTMFRMLRALPLPQPGVLATTPATIATPAAAPTGSAIASTGQEQGKIDLDRCPTSPSCQVATKSPAARKYAVTAKPLNTASAHMIR